MLNLFLPRSVKPVTETIAPVWEGDTRLVIITGKSDNTREEAWGGYIRARVHHREVRPNSPQ